MQAVIYALLSAVLVSLVTIVGAIPLFLKKKISDKVLVVLLSVSAGTLLGSVFLQLIPEASSHGYTLGLAIYLMAGFLTFFILEKFIHAHHAHGQHDHCHDEHHCHAEKPHSHGYVLGVLNLIGDGVHNFVDGLLIGASYMISLPLGIAATISIALHELPQEIADFGLLLYAGYSKKRAIFYNFLSGVTAVVGTIVGILLTSRLSSFNTFIIPFTAGVFLYIAATNLVPELHRHCKLKDTLVHLVALVLGFALIAVITIYGPAHVHA